ncbi:LysR family transcriptional regulator [Yinghuangia soli]|uniref:LysR family transcriptional regulator n=1 Tax=Yinghuangia soli TaxID=2908204 RepID=A0AA41Q5S9_9ACTN|nr:LysR family transcriptional regulator [Yinghuangia soli]MCF2532084.1 LysR family transcriptional regulator [Yinghuangia soli]
MERHEMEIFLTLAEELHFGRTAERLHLSGAMVSQTLKKVERRLGGPLFERTSRRVALTPLGSQLYADLRPHFDAIQEAVSRAASAARGIEGVLRVGFLGVQSGLHAHKAAALFRERHPDCAVEVHEVQLRDYIHPLRDGRLDMQVTLIPLDEPDITVGPVVLDSPIHIAVPVRSPLAERAELAYDDIAGERFPAIVPEVPESWLTPYHPARSSAGVPIARTEQVCGTYQEILALVAAGECVAIGDAQLLEYYQRPDVRYVPAKDTPYLQHALVWRTAAENARMRAYVEAIREMTAPSPAQA